MAEVQTTAGPIDSGDLGLTLIHEHLRVRSDAVVAAFPHVYDEEFEYARAIQFVKRVAEETGVQLVVATGIYTYHYLPPHFQNRDIDYMVDLFVRDIEVGIQGTDVRASFIKCCTDHQGVTEDVEKVLRAAAKASLRTGRPIMTHSHPQSGQGLEQIKIFEEEGIDPAKVLIGHTG